MSAFLFIDWTTVAAVAGAASILAGAWLAEMRERRDNAAAANEWRQNVAKLENEIYDLQRQTAALKGIAEEHGRKLGEL